MPFSTTRAVILSIPLLEIWHSVLPSLKPGFHPSVVSQRLGIQRPQLEIIRLSKELTVKLLATLIVLTLTALSVA